MPRTLLAASASLLLGMALGFFSRPEEPECPRCPEVPRATPPRAPVEPAPPPPPDGRPTTRFGASEDEDLIALRNRVEKLERENQIQKLLLVQHEGAAPKEPSQKPPRLEGAEIRAALGSSLSETGLAWAQVTRLDCTEYPCIVYVAGLRGQHETDRLFNAPSMQPYKQDSVYSFCTGGIRTDAGRADFCGFAVTPRRGPNEDPEAVAKRIRHRVGMVVETLK